MDREKGYFNKSGALPEGWLRKDIISLLSERFWTLDELAKFCQLKGSDLKIHLRHLFRSLKHSSYKLIVQKAKCRSCGFEFSRDDLDKPSKCPRCRSNWIRPPWFKIKLRNGK